MKNLMKSCLLLVSLSAFALTGFGQAVFQDDYWGGQPTSPSWQTDVVGPLDPFDLDRAEVTFDGTNLTINIFGNYFDDVVANSSNLVGTTMGDLFITTTGLSWEGETGADTLDDYFGNPNGYTQWNYAVDLHFATQNILGQTGNLLAIQESDIILSNPGPNNNYRANQAWAVNPEQARGIDSVFVLWGIQTNGSEDYLSINLLNWTSVFAPGTEVGFHWTMSCANDVMEWGGVVPEPSTVGLIGVAALGGLLMIRRRLTRRK